MKNHSLALSLLLVIICVGVSIISSKLNRGEMRVSPSKLDMGSAIPTEIHGVKILKQPSESMLAELDAPSWPKIKMYTLMNGRKFDRWEGGPSKFPWTFEATETMYFVEGKVKVYVGGHEAEEEAFEIGAGDMVVFPKGMKVVWEITKAVKKHYSLEK
ncbi:PREDICTED: uncharacterized protein LOC104815640 isoform X1 [Tarenaya hassleriana]|uniref:uncharacterized protein LOC104815640 isoform X1 n=1 Tax=Tarenaya hassleriana TaxID=28532 RepID=UPI00053C669C|nr:PREDICTED: uncharacterized protein LOC104815640 isoform X1 [Tarenaya hassleriana]